MLNSIKTAALAAIVGLGGIAALPANAQADSVYFGFGSGHAGPRLGVHVVDRA